MKVIKIGLSVIIIFRLLVVLNNIIHGHWYPKWGSWEDIENSLVGIYVFILYLLSRSEQPKEQSEKETIIPMKEQIRRQVDPAKFIQIETVAIEILSKSGNAKTEEEVWCKVNEYMIQNPTAFQ